MEMLIHPKIKNKLVNKETQAEIKYKTQTQIQSKILITISLFSPQYAHFPIEETESKFLLASDRCLLKH